MAPWERRGGPGGLRAMMALLGPEDIGIVLVIAALMFGGKKIPELARSLGRAKSEFQKGLREGDSEPKDGAG